MGRLRLDDLCRFYQLKEIVERDRVGGLTVSQHPIELVKRVPFFELLDSTDRPNLFGPVQQLRAAITIWPEDPGVPRLVLDVRPVHLNLFRLLLIPG